MMNQKDQLKFEIMSKLVANLIDYKLASQALNVSYRTIWRYKKKFMDKGSQFLIHGNKNKKSHNCFSIEDKNKIIKLLVDKYYDFSVRHAWEKLMNEEVNLPNISYKTLLRWCQEKHFIKSIKKKRKKVHKARVRMSRTGMMLLMDGSFHHWFGNEKTCLIGAIDDASNEIAYAEFFDSENTLDCMKVIQEIINRKGKFDILYTDKAGVFGGNKRQDFCQLENACKELGIQIIYAHTAEAKGRVERLWRTLQGRLIPEMRLAGIKTKKEATIYLHEKFIPTYYNKNCVVETISNETNYKPNFRKDLKEIFCAKEYRSIQNDQTFNYNREKYLIENYSGNLANKVVEIRTYQDRSQKYFWMDFELVVSINKTMKKAA